MLKDPIPSSGRRFHVVSAAYWPPNAPSLGPKHSSEMVEWRRTVISKSAKGASRFLTLAWIIHGLSMRDGYVVASNAALAREAMIPEKKIDGVLGALEEDELIVRGNISTPSGFQRRIWPTLPYPLQRGTLEPPSRGQNIPPSRENRDRVTYGSGSPKTRQFPKSELESARMEADRKSGVGAASSLLDEIRGK